MRRRGAPRSCYTVSGEIGSGKSSVARLLADRTSAEYHSTGSLQRELAAGRKLTTLEMNLLSETEPTIDEQIDGFTRQLAATGKQLVIDSRLAWNFVPEALKVFLLVETEQAAARVMGDQESRVQTEAYQASADAIRDILARQESERRRFLSTYGVDLFRWSNYDLVIDTSEISPEETVELILDHPEGSPRTRLWLGPRAVYPTEPFRGLAPSALQQRMAAMREESSHAAAPLPVVASLDREFYAIDDHVGLSCALQLHLSLIPCTLVGQEPDEVAPGMSVATLLAEKIDENLLSDWEAAHEFRFKSYPQADAEHCAANEER